MRIIKNVLLKDLLNVWENSMRITTKIIESEKDFKCINNRFFQLFELSDEQRTKSEAPPNPIHRQIEIIFEK